MTNDFIGIEGTVEAVSIKNGHIRVQLDLALNTELLAELAVNVERPVFVGFGFMQTALPFTDQSNGATQAFPFMVTSDGEKVLAHRFVEDKRDKRLCAICSLTGEHAIHSEESQKLRDQTAAPANA